MPKDKTGRAAARQHRIGTHRSAHPYAPGGGHSGLLPIDYEMAEDICRVLDAIGPPPQELIDMAAQRTGGTAGQAFVNRRDLRAYHPRAAEAVMQLVGDGWCTVRIQQNSLLLYPIDGSSPYGVNARKDDREWKQLQQWIRRHIAADGHPLGVKPDQIIQKAAEELAAAVNDPVEHPVPTPPRSPKVTKVEDVPVPQLEAEWKPYVGTSGEPLPNWETDGTYIRCRACHADPDVDDWQTTERASLGGHWRTVHDREGLDTEETTSKRTDSRRFNKLSSEVEAAIELLSDAIGKEGGNAKYIAELEAANDRLAKQASDARRLLAEVTQERDDCQARLNLLREAMGA